MKFHLSFFFFVVILCSCNNKSKSSLSTLPVPLKSFTKTIPQNNNVYIENIKDTVELLKVFFDVDTVKDKVALWAPDMDGRFNMNISDDEYCHTNLDTIITMSDRDEYFLVFTTFNCQKNGRHSNSHVDGAIYSIARIEKDQYGFYIYEFTRRLNAMGEFGNKGIIKLEKFGPDQYVLHTISERGGTSGKYTDEKLYDLDFNLEFSFCSYEESNMDTTETGYQVITRVMTHNLDERIDADEDVIKLACTFKRFDKVKNKLVSKMHDECYSYNDSEEKYEKVRF